MIKIDNLVLNEQYQINQEILNDEIIFYYSRDNELIKRLFLLISGINKVDGIYYNGISCYDNKEYFDKRIYLSLNDSLIKTIYPKKISLSLKNFNLRCNQEKLAHVIDTLNIREECMMSSDDPFTLAGNTLINYALLESIDKEILLINNPTIHLTQAKQIDFITTNITTNTKQIKLIGLNNIKHFKEKINQIIVFNDYGRTLKFNPRNVQIGLINGDARGILEIIHDYQSLFYTYKNDQFELLFLYNNLDNDQIKELSKSNYKIKKVDFYNIEDYL